MERGQPKEDRQGSGSGGPYCRLTLGQLEGMFANRRSDPVFLRVLDHELGFRATDRADRLRKRVGKTLAALPETAAPASGQRKRHVARPATSAAESAQVTPKNRTAPHAVSHTGTADAPDAVLSAWTAMEALSPQTYRKPEDLAAGDKRCVAALAGGGLPWEADEGSRKGYRLYYLVVLGAIPMAKASEHLATAFGEDEERTPRLREKAAIAALLVDRNGLLAEEGGISVSSFAWALPQALRLEFEGMGTWPDAEPAIVEQLETILRQRDEEGLALPLDKASIDRAHRWLVKEFGLTSELVEPPSFAIRIYQYYKIKHAPEAALLNSFFLSDLTKAQALLKQGRVPVGLRRYLGQDAPPKIVDLLTDTNALEQAVAPAAMPLARWPHPGGHSLVLLQQAAVNLARSELAGGEGIVAVNGPPGTGKTTLLRDLVAASVFDRALAMTTFDDPEAAFTASGESVAVGEKAAFKIYRLDPALRGHEIVVASINNKAVENISRELPAATAIGRETEEFAYFQSVGALLQSAPAASDEVEEGGAISPTGESWGMIAAVLGNRRNLAAFQQAFWWDDERSFRLYLKAAKGDDVTRDVRDPKTGAMQARRPPAVVQAERPPLPETSRTAWRKACERFLALKREVEDELKILENVRQQCLALKACRDELAKSKSEIEAIHAQEKEARSLAAHTVARHQASVNAYEARVTAVSDSRKFRPSPIQWLFRTERWKTWVSSHAPLTAAVAEAAVRVREGERDQETIAVKREALRREGSKAEHRHAALEQREVRLAREIEARRPALGDRIVDDALFTRGHDIAHRASPWLPDGLQRKREDLFAAALGVHRAFIDVAARRIYHNLGALMDVFSNGLPKNDATRKLMGDLWSTLHLAVPVVSTTFASAQRMLGSLPPASIGWLLIDEAGQAHPQSAVGAITRAKRTVVVGDPLQIQPVVALPERLGATLCRRFNIDVAQWSAPQASAQTVADRLSRFQAAFGAADGVRRVGIPLLVHRRCREPMFGLFNRIAYDGQMVPGSMSIEHSPIGAALGPSKWIDVTGTAETKWCPAEGKATIDLLKTIAASGVKKPDLFIVSPFRIVAQELRRMLEKEGALFAAMDVNARDWVADRVGTIHTVQGREAEAVVLVLGAPNAAQKRAREWAAETPNVFNVALSRARHAYYIVGSRDAWSGVGHGAQLATLPCEPNLASPVTAPSFQRSLAKNARPEKIRGLRQRPGPRL